jgi:hypothetical protein
MPFEDCLLAQKISPTPISHITLHLTVTTLLVFLTTRFEIFRIV